MLMCSSWFLLGLESIAQSWSRNQSSPADVFESIPVGGCKYKRYLRYISTDEQLYVMSIRTLNVWIFKIWWARCAIRMRIFCFVKFKCVLLKTRGSKNHRHMERPKERVFYCPSITCKHTLNKNMKKCIQQNQQDVHDIAYLAHLSLPVPGLFSMPAGNGRSW